MPTYDDVIVEYMTTGQAAKLFGLTDTRSVVRLAETGELRALRLPSGHWRIERSSVLEAIARFAEQSQAS